MDDDLTGLEETGLVLICRTPDQDTASWLQLKSSAPRLIYIQEACICLCLNGRDQAIKEAAELQ